MRTHVDWHQPGQQGAANVHRGVLYGFRVEAAIGIPWMSYIAVTRDWTIIFMIMFVIVINVLYPLVLMPKLFGCRKCASGDQCAKRASRDGWCLYWRIKLPMTGC